jgi:Zn-dependent M16 (insulinase) family peptidase
MGPALKKINFSPAGTCKIYFILLLKTILVDNNSYFRVILDMADENKTNADLEIKTPKQLEKERLKKEKLQKLQEKLEKQKVATPSSKEKQEVTK